MARCVGLGERVALVGTPLSARLWLVPPLDPTALALLSIFGGVLLTIVAGGIGALIQRSHEHTKWLRDQRLRVYSEHLAATDDFLRAAQNGDPAEAQVVAATSIRALAALQLVGPERVYDAANEFQAAMKASVKALEARSGYHVSDMFTPEQNRQNIAELDQILDTAENARLAARKRFLTLAQKQVRAR